MTADQEARGAVEGVTELLNVSERLAMPDSAIEEVVWRMHPRFRAFKTLPIDAAVLDIGAGSGGLAVWKRWLEPLRPDLGCYAVDLNRGEWAAEYRDWVIADLDKEVPDLSGVLFDAFFASHVIEHLESLDSLLDYMEGVAHPGARAYLEWPSPRTVRFPTARFLQSVDFEIQTSNFFDDATHRQTFEIVDVASRLAARGFKPVEQGEIRLGALAEELIARGRRLDRLDWRQLGFWSATGWCSYVIAERAFT